MQAEIKIKITQASPVIIPGSKLPPPKAEARIYFKGCKADQVKAVMRAVSQRLKKQQIQCSVVDVDGFVEILNK